MTYSNGNMVYLFSKAMVCPIATQRMTEDEEHMTTHDAWQHVFITASTIHVFGVIFYAVTASGDVQDWAEA